MTSVTEHKFTPETTNGGNVFCDCSCGWSGGVYSYRDLARSAWKAHVNGNPIPEAGKQLPVIMFGDPPRGVTDDIRD